MPQSYEFWHALKTLRVTTQFVIYPTKVTSSLSQSTGATSSDAWLPGSTNTSSKTMSERPVIRPQSTGVLAPSPDHDAGAQSLGRVAKPILR